MRWVLGEALRNVVSGTSRLLGGALLLAAVVGMLVAWEVIGTDQLLVRADAFRSSGATGLTITAAGSIDATACDSLGSADGVQAAGAVRREQSDLVPATLPRGPVATYGVSLGLIDVLDIAQDDPTGAGVVLSRDVADRLGLGTGDPLLTAQGTTRVSAVYAWPDDGRRSGFASAALVPTVETTGFDECWVAASPVPANLAPLLRTAVVPDPTGATVVTQGRLNSTFGESLDGSRLFAERATRAAVWGAMLAGAAIGFAAVRARKVELASARHVGAGQGAQVWGVLIEVAAIVLVSLVLVAAVTAVLQARSSGLDPDALRAVAVHVVLPAHVSMALGSVAAVTTVREKNLARYVSRR